MPDPEREPFPPKPPFFLRTAPFWAGLHGVLAVGMGAFAAHGITDPRAAGWLETGSRYQLSHAVALLALAAWTGRAGYGRAAGIAAVAFAVGPLLFSGALYGLALTHIRILGAVAPVGGTVMILGWVAVLWAGVAARREGG